MPRYGNTTQRGLGTDHQRLRRQLAPLVAAGQAICTICHQRIQPGQPWHLDHKADRSGYRGAAHQTCNCSDGGRRSHGPKRIQPSRTDW